MAPRISTHPAPTPAPAAIVPAPVAAVALAPVAVSPAMARVREIMYHPAAAGRTALAWHLALDTNFTAAEAVTRLAATAQEPSPVIASGAAGAAVARAAMGLPPDPAADLAMATGIAATLGAPAGADAAASAKWSSDFEAGAATAKALLGR